MPTNFVCVFLTFFKTNSDSFPKQQWQIRVYVRNGFCAVWSMNWILVYNLYEIRSFSMKVRLIVMFVSVRTPVFNFLFCITEPRNACDEALKYDLYPCKVSTEFSWTQWPRGPRRRSAAACLLGLRVRVLLEACMSVSYECCVFSATGRSLV